MTSRIIQLTVLDVLATGMTLRRGVDFQPHLRKIKESLNASRYPAGDDPTEPRQPPHGSLAPTPRLQAQVGLLPGARLRACRCHWQPRHRQTRDLGPAHPQQRPGARVPDHGVGAVTGIDAQRALPGTVLLQLTLVLEYPLAATLDPQLALLPAGLAIQMVVTLGAIEPRQRYLTDVTNTPVGLQCMAQLAGFAVLVLGAQAQVHAPPQVRMQVDLPVAQLQLPMSGAHRRQFAAVQQASSPASAPSHGMARHSRSGWRPYQGQHTGTPHGSPPHLRPLRRRTTARASAPAG